MRPTTSLCTFACLLCLLLLTGSPAHAQTRSKSDPVGDAPARIDITEARYTHTTKRVRVRARVPELGRAGNAALSVSRFEIFEAGYVVRIRKRAGETSQVRLFYFDHFDLNKRRCAGVRGAWGTKAVRLSVPLRCLDGHASRNVFTQFGIGRGGDIDRAPAVRRLRRD